MGLCVIAAFPGLTESLATVMKFAFRTDASLEIGSGHVMRCLTLADALKERGVICCFVSREHEGHLNEIIRTRGYTVYGLPAKGETPARASDHTAESLPAHARWLGTDWQTDARATAKILQGERVDCIIVDHYALDANWEVILRPVCDRLVVIDDLADRKHDCDVVLDQNLGRSESDYDGLVPAGCTILAGCNFAILRPQFLKLREESFARRLEPTLEHLLITMGGVDQLNITGDVLEALKLCPLPQDCRITVVMGANAPWVDRVKKVAETLSWPASIRVNVSDMAELMANSDLVIGAPGSSSWERACLGVPSFVVVLAENQRRIAEELQKKGVVKVVDGGKEMSSALHLVFEEFANADSLRAMSAQASLLTDGLGTDRVLQQLL